MIFYLVFSTFTANDIMAFMLEIIRLFANVMLITALMFHNQHLFAHEMQHGIQEKLVIFLCQKVMCTIL